MAKLQWKFLGLMRDIWHYVSKVFACIYRDTKNNGRYDPVLVFCATVMYLLIGLTALLYLALITGLLN